MKPDAASEAPIVAEKSCSAEVPTSCLFAGCVIGVARSSMLLLALDAIVCN